jgi:hypothetical protein
VDEIGGIWGNSLLLQHCWKVRSVSIRFVPTYSPSSQTVLVHAS